MGNSCRHSPKVVPDEQMMAKEQLKRTNAAAVSPIPRLPPSKPENNFLTPPREVLGKNIIAKEMESQTNPSLNGVSKESTDISSQLPPAPPLPTENGELSGTKLNSELTSVLKPEVNVVENPEPAKPAAKFKVEPAETIKVEETVEKSVEEPIEIEKVEENVQKSVEEPKAVVKVEETVEKSVEEPTEIVKAEKDVPKSADEPIAKVEKVAEESKEIVETIETEHKLESTVDISHMEKEVTPGSSKEVIEKLAKEEIIPKEASEAIEKKIEQIDKEEKVAEPVETAPKTLESQLKDNHLLSTLIIHDAAQKCLSSDKDKTAIENSEAQKAKEIATKYAESLVTDILITAQSKSQELIEQSLAAEQSKKLSTEALIQTIHEMCQNSLLHKDSSPSILSSQTEREETIAVLKNLIKNLTEETPKQASSSVTTKSSNANDAEKKVMEIHEGAQASLLAKDGKEPTSILTRPSRKEREGGPKISVSFAEGKEYLQTPSSPSVKQYATDDEIVEDTGPKSPKSRIMNRRPTGPFLPQLDKFNFKAGKNMMSISGDDEEEEEEEEDEDEDDSPPKPSTSVKFEQRRSQGSVEENEKAKNMGNLISMFEEPRRVSK